MATVTGSILDSQTNFPPLLEPEGSLQYSQDSKKLDPIFRKKNIVHTLKSHFFEIHFNSILPSTSLVSRATAFRLVFRPKCTHLSSPPCAINKSPAHLFLLRFIPLISIEEYKLQSFSLCNTVYFSPPFYYSLPLRTEYSPQYTVLHTRLHTRVAWCRIWNETATDMCIQLQPKCVYSYSRTCSMRQANDSFKASLEFNYLFVVLRLSPLELDV
jgi:hypothetical protein